MPRPIFSLSPDQRERLSLRLFYFLLIGGGGLLSPFINLFYTRQGLSGTEIGLLSTISAVCAMLISPFWGHWGDRSQQPRRLMQAGLVATALIALVLGLQHSFLGFGTFTGLSALVGAGISPLSVILALEVIQRQGQGGFGEVRRWGSLGWAVLVLAGGWLVARAGLGAIFPAYAAAMAASALSLQLLTQSKKTGAAAPAPHRSILSGLFSPFRSLAADHALLGLALSMVVWGVLSVGMRLFQTVYLDQLGASAQVIGLSSMAGSVIELPSMLWADRAVRRFGPGAVLIASYVLDGLRMAFILLFPSVPAIVAMSAVGGFTFSFRTVGTIGYITERSQEQQSTLMALFNVTLANLINIISSPLGGLAFDLVGARRLYALALAGGLLAALSIWLLTPRNQEKRVIVAARESAGGAIHE